MPEFDLGDPFDFLTPSPYTGARLGLATLIVGDVWLVSTRQRAKCSDISDEAVLELLLAAALNDDNAMRWVQNWTLVDHFRLPWSLVNAKMMKLKKRGLVNGCGCGCRGDWNLTMKGLKAMDDA